MLMVELCRCSVEPYAHPYEFNSYARNAEVNESFKNAQRPLNRNYCRKILGFQLEKRGNIVFQIQIVVFVRLQSKQKIKSVYPCC